MRTRWLVLVIAFALVPPLSADTILQTNAQGEQVVVQRDAIVVNEDSSILVYKHFELKERRVEKIILNKGSLPYRVELSSATDRQRIVNLWKEFGFTADVTDAEGKTTQVYDTYIDFYPPKDRGFLLESVPARTALSLLLDQGGADEVEFSNIVKFKVQGNELTVNLRNGRVEKGRFLMPISEPAEARFLGITDRYKASSGDVFDFSIPLSKLKEVRFIP